MASIWIKLKQLLHTADNEPLQTYENQASLGKYFMGVKNPHLEELIGAIDEAKVTNPDAAEARALGLLRGILQGVIDSNDTEILGDILAAMPSDPATNTTLETVLDATESPGNGTAITPNDTTDLANVTKEIYVGVAGDIKIDLVTSGTVTLKNVPAGRLKVRVKRVYATGTTATDLVALW